MSTRREFLKLTTAAGIAIGAPAQLVGAADGKVANAHAAAGRARSASKTRTYIKSVVRREETVLRYGGHGDNWHMSWAADDRQYLSLCDGAGFSDRPSASYNSRMLVIEGGPRDARFHDLAGYPMLGAPVQQRRDARYYNFGTLAHDGYLFQFMSTFNRPFRSDAPGQSGGDSLLRFNGAKLIYSPDNGRSWRNQDGSTPLVWEPWERRSRETMVFFEEDQEAFSLLTVLQMGRNYEHNRDGYVYVYAPNGNTEGSMNELVMFRVPNGKLLDRKNYEYFAGQGSNGGARWTRDIGSRKAIHTFPRGWVNTLVHPYAWQPSVVYNAPLDMYMMANWGTGIASGTTWFGKPSYLGFWVAQNPWGPWTQIHEETAWMPGGDPAARAYQPQIAPKWIAADGKSFWLVWTDFQGYDSAPMKDWWAEYGKKADANALGEPDVMRNVSMMRKYMPYYSFNVQRVDLVV